MRKKKKTQRFFKYDDAKTSAAAHLSTHTQSDAC